MAETKMIFEGTRIVKIFSLALLLGAFVISSAFAACPVNYPLPDDQLIPSAIYLKKDTSNLYWKAVYTNLNRDALDCPGKFEVANNGPTLVLSGLTSQPTNNSAVISRVWKWICSGYCTNAGGMSGELVIQKDEQTPAIVQGNEIIGQIGLATMASAGFSLPSDFSKVQMGYLFYVEDVAQPTANTPYGAINADKFRSLTTLTSEWQQIYPVDPSTKVQVTNISVDGAILNQITTFTIMGKNLPDGMILTMDSCESTYPAGAGTATARTFQCTPIGFAGSKALTLKASSGEVYYQTTVTVADHADGSVCDAVIDENTLKLTIPVLFHQTPSGKINVFSSTLTYLGDGKFSTTTTDTQKLSKEADDYFDCAPAYTSDRLTVLLPNIRMGNQSYWGFLRLLGQVGTSFVFQVGGTGNE